MDTEAIREKFEAWWQTTGKKDLVSYTSGISSNRLTINYKEMAFEAYQQAVKDMEEEIVERAERLKLAKASTYHNEMGKLLKRLFGVDYNCQRQGKYDHDQ